MSAALAVDRRTVGHLARPVPLLAASTTCGALADQFAHHPELPAFAIRRDLDQFDLIDRATFLPSYLAGYNRDLFQNTLVSRFWQARTLVVPADTPTDHVGVLMTRDYPELLNSGFIITRGGDFLGIGLSIDLMRALAAIAEESNLAKNTFLANMNHELRTPLNAVIGNLELLSLGTLDAEQRELARMARVSADSLLQLIGDLLDLSKIQAQRLDLELSETRIADLVDEVLTITMPRARQKGLRLIWRIASDLPESLVTDRLRLRQVLVNLVGNAVKFTDAGRVVLTVSRRQRGPDAATVHFEVVDTGPGFDPARAQQLFEPFVQEDVSTTRRFGGTGLGLAISKSIIERMGGEVGCAAEPGLGAAFWCAVPLPPAAPAVRPAIGLRGQHVVICGAGDTAVALASELGRLDGVVTLRGLSDRVGVETAPALVVIVAGGEDEAAVLEAIAAWSPQTTALVVVVEAASASFGYRARRAGADHVLVAPLDGVELVGLTRPAGAAATPGAALAPSDVPAPLAGGRILVIDDTLTNRELAARQLRMLGFECVTAANGAEGLQLASAQLHRAILVDASMPVMDGIEFVRRWRAVEADAGMAPTPVIVVTAHAMAGDAERFMALGADGYLPKPVTLARLREMLLRLTAGPGSGKRPAPAVPSPGEAFDIAALGEMIGDDDRDALGELLAVFGEELPSLQAEIGAAVRNFDREALGRAAHAAKSAAGSACAGSLAAALAALERAAPHETPERLAGLFAEAETEFSRARAALDRA